MTTPAPRPVTPVIDDAAADTETLVDMGVIEAPPEPSPEPPPPPLNDYGFAQDPS